MKTLGIFAAGLLIPIIGLADTIVSSGTLVGVPQNFQSTTGTGSAPFWNNNSVDGANMNAGDYLTGSNPATGSTNYLGTGSSFGDFLAAATNTAPSFTLLQSADSVQATLLFTDSNANYSYTLPGFMGTQIGLYDVADPSQTVTLFSSGSLFNMNATNGVFNNNVSPQSTQTVSTWANYGIYASSCWFTTFPSPFYCNTYYSGTSQNFSLFENPQSPNTFYIGFEDGIYPSVEGKGDYNDVIFKLQTTQLDPPVTFGALFEPGGDNPPAVTPEPATFSILGLGLAGLGLLRRSRLKKGLQ